MQMRFIYVYIHIIMSLHTPDAAAMEGAAARKISEKAASREEAAGWEGCLTAGRLVLGCSAVEIPIHTI